MPERPDFKSLMHDFREGETTDVWVQAEHRIFAYVGSLESQSERLNDEVDRIRNEAASVATGQVRLAQTIERLRRLLAEGLDHVASMHRDTGDGCAVEEWMHEVAALASTGSEPDEHRFEPMFRDAPSTAATSWDYSRCNVCKRPITDGIHVTVSTGSEE